MGFDRGLSSHLEGFNLVYSVFIGFGRVLYGLHGFYRVCRAFIGFVGLSSCSEGL